MSATPKDTQAKPAPLWRRLAAIMYDSFLVLAIMFLVGFINLGIQMKVNGAEKLKAMTDSGQSIGGPFFYAALFLSIFSFFAFFWSRRGQTLGMQAWNLRIVDQEGGYISIGQCLVRTLTAIPAFLLCGLGLFWCLLDKEQRSWQDLLSRSRTLHIPKRKA
ncbi:RDD family protein [Endozoicomonas arenosclerae]|uniref:RDD family protein n=1 Tax=Endozoicomonas arenosclerae TaxID=1633495 RepID=UPI000784D667|nr:RDD family protein [Endozoicomonas arenosclerae]